MLDVHGPRVSAVVCRLSMGGFLSLVLDITKPGSEAALDGGGLVSIPTADSSICGSISSTDLETILAQFPKAGN